MIARTATVWAVLLGIVFLQGCKKTPRSTQAPLQASGTTSPPANAVQREMRLLRESLRDSVTAIGDGTPDAIPALLEQVDAARRATDRAVESGEYRLPKNPEDLATFQHLDDQFHADLETLAAKARSNDAAAVGLQLGVVLSQCGTCHARFRR